MNDVQMFKFIKIKQRKKFLFFKKKENELIAKIEKIVEKFNKKYQGLAKATLTKDVDDNLAKTMVKIFSNKLTKVM